VNPVAAPVSCSISDEGARSSISLVQQTTFDEAYQSCFAFVFRNARRLGVRDRSIDDVVQEVFLVVHRRLGEYDERLPLKAWVYGILSRVVRDYRRTIRRKEHGVISTETDSSSHMALAPAALDPGRQAEQQEAWRLLLELLDCLDDDKRELLVLAELEQMTVPEISTALGTNLNTTYSRLKAAKKAFAEVHARHKARASWRGGS
jgi:RNA polymerase sigma-70 factor (ECF subfamily)